MGRGMLVTFEGGEGTGKTTQIQKLAKTLESRGFSALTTREPGGVKVSELIRGILLSPEIEAMDPVAELFLFAASRKEIITKLLIPKLEEYDFIIADRFYDSTTAYQGYGRGLDLKEVKEVIALTVGSFHPDFTILLDIDVETGLERSMSVEITRFENEDLEFHERVRAGFLAIAEEEPERVAVVDASGTIEEVAADVWDLFTQRFKEVQNGRNSA